MKKYIYIHDGCISTKHCASECKETKGFEGTEHEGVDMCNDGCVYATHLNVVQAVDRLNELDQKLTALVEATADKSGQFRAWHQHLKSCTAQAQKTLDK